MYTYIKRGIDLFISFVVLIIFLIPIIIISFLVKLTSNGPILYWSDRIGINSKIFRMPKFRTMRVETPEVATHLLTDGKIYLTSIGAFLRKSSLDEIPQLWSIIKGDMSLIGPRPALFNQDDLIELRKKANVDSIKPGLTGLAQINGRDDLSVSDKVKWDIEYMNTQSILLDTKIIFITFSNVINRNGISH